MPTSSTSEQTALSLKKVIESVYTDGISAILKTSQDSKGVVTGKFADGSQVYDFSISPKGELEYNEMEASGGRSDAYLTGYTVDSGMALHGHRLDRKKPSTCPKGKRCGGSCVARGFACRTQLSIGAMTLLKDVKSKIPVIPASASIPAIPKIPFDVDPKLVKRLLVAGIGVGAVYAAIGGVNHTITKDLENSSTPFDSVRQAPNGVPDAETLKTYDTFQPGDLIRKNIKSDQLGNRQHYGIYAGKDPHTGDHMIIDTGVDWKSRDGLPFVKKSGMTWNAGPNDSDYEKVPASEIYQKEGTQKFSREEVLRRAELMMHQRFTYQGFDSNCESFARTIVEGKSYSVQGDKNSPLTRFVAGTVTDNLLKLRTQNLHFPGAAGEKGFKVGEWTFTGWSDYAREPHKMTTIEMAEWLNKERVMKTRREVWEQIPNPYNGQVEKKGRNLDPRRALPQSDASPFDIAMDRKSKRKRDADSTVDDWLDSVGIKSPEDFEANVELIASQFPGISDLLRVELYKNYLMLVLAMLHQEISPTVSKTDAIDRASDSVKPIDPQLQKFVGALLKPAIRKVYADISQVIKVEPKDSGLSGYFSDSRNRVFQFDFGGDGKLSYKSAARNDFLGKDQCEKGMPCGASCVPQGDRCNTDLGESGKAIVGMALKTFHTEQLPERQELARVMGVATKEFLQNPVKAVKQGLAREKLVRQAVELQTGKPVPTKPALMKQAGQKMANFVQNLAKKNAEEGAVNAVGFTGSVVGGAVAGPIGALAGDLGGALATRKAITDYKAFKRASKSLADDEAFKSAGALSKLKQLGAATLSELKSAEMQKEIEDNVTGDVGGWAIGNGADKALSALGSGIPLQGAAVAIAKTPSVVKAHRRIREGEAVGKVVRETVQELSPARAVKQGNDREKRARAAASQHIRAYKKGVA